MLVTGAGTESLVREAPIRDADVRPALRRYLQREQSANPNMLLIEELGLCQGQARIDLLTVSGVLHGYEIKSNRDRLTRLASQAATYSRVLDRVTLVVCPRHFEAALQLVPKWWGVLLVRGSVEAVSLEPFPGRPMGSTGLCVRKSPLADLPVRRSVARHRGRHRRLSRDRIRYIAGVGRGSGATHAQAWLRRSTERQVHSMANSPRQPPEGSRRRAETGLRILYVGDDKKIGEHVKERDRAKYLREEYWERFAPWPGLSSGRPAALYRTPRSEFGLAPDSPGDRFYFYADAEGPSTGMLWTEVTEVYESDVVAAKVNAFIRSRLRLPMSPKSRTIDIDGFESAIDTLLPSADRENNMLRKVAKGIQDKLNKYSGMVEEYGKGRLVVGLPLWFAMRPTDLAPAQEPCLDSEGFFCGMRRWLDHVCGPMLSDPTCPFALVQVVWEPSWQALSQWIGNAGRPLGPLDETTPFEQRHFMWMPMTLQVGEEPFTPPGQLLDRVTGRAAKIADHLHRTMQQR